MDSDSHSQPSDSAPEVDENRTMETVRDLLFGKQSREINDQIATLERRLVSAIEEIERNMHNRFESLEQFVRGEIGSTNERFEHEKSEHEKRQSETGERVKSLGEALSERFTKLENAITRVETEARTQIFERAKTLSGEIAESSRKLRDTLDHEIGGLKQNAAQRGQLGEWLIELGMRLQPGGGEGDDKPAS